MRHILMILSFFLLSAASMSQANDTLQVHFFGSSTCGECMEIEQTLLLPLQAQYPSQLHMHFYDTDEDSGLTQLVKMEKMFGVTSNSSQMLFFPDTFLSGYDDIMAKGKEMIISRFNSTLKTTPHDQSADSTDLTAFLHSKAMDWGFLAGTVATGMADGINPCAIATMIFLISFMTTKKRKRNEILSIGLVYSATVFITYLAMGLGLKGVLEQFKGYHIVSLVIRWGAFTLAALVALFSFRDAIVFKKSQDTSDIKLQLPTVVKLRIHKIISGNLSGTGLVIGAIVTGFLVTLLEAICTGQMYLPYIVAMTQRDSLRLHGYLYLIFYNFLFVLPLLVVMVLAYFGMKWTQLAKKTQKNMVMLKIILGCVMTGLAVYIVSGLIHF